ncbi:MAG: hypothetical protein K8T89_06255 [Planctomycetes bacterium]|nr:hypothetical protein [Planctomycetota bacterium]
MAATVNEPGLVSTEEGAIYTLSNGNVIHYRKVNGIFYHAETPRAVVRALENARSCCRRRVRLYYGDAGSGRGWLDVTGMEGSIGNSMGPLKIPILLANRRSHGGPGLLDHCIVKLKWTTGGILYQHPRYHTGTFTIREIGSEEMCGGENLRAKGYTHAVDVDNQDHANFRSVQAAERYVRRMTS